MIGRNFPPVTGVLFGPLVLIVEVLLARFVKHDALEGFQVRRARQTGGLDERPNRGVAFLNLGVEIIQDRLKARHGNDPVQDGVLRINLGDGAFVLLVGVGVFTVQVVDNLADFVSALRAGAHDHGHQLFDRVRLAGAGHAEHSRAPGEEINGVQVEYHMARRVSPMQPVRGGKTHGADGKPGQRGLESHPPRLLRRRYGALGADVINDGFQRSGPGTIHPKLGGIEIRFKVRAQAKRAVLIVKCAENAAGQAAELYLALGGGVHFLPDGLDGAVFESAIFNPINLSSTGNGAEPITRSRIASPAGSPGTTEVASRKQFRGMPWACVFQTSLVRTAALS